MLSVLAFGSVFGFLGALLALPSAAMIQLLVDRALASANTTDQPPPPAERDVGSLVGESRELVDMAEAFTEKTDPAGNPLPERLTSELKAITHDLDEVLVKIQEQDVARW